MQNLKKSKNLDFLQKFEIFNQNNAKNQDNNHLLDVVDKIWFEWRKNGEIRTLG